jgi:DNA-binding response OmpR family regulator
MGIVDIEEKVAAAGCADYIRKPFEPRELLEKIGKTLSA